MLNPLRWFIRDEAETYTLGDDSVLQAFYGALSQLSASGVRVTQENAVRCIAVLACLIVRAETFSALPVHVLEAAGRDAIEADDHPAARLLNVAPNDLMTAREFWRWKQLREDTTGNAYARIVWGKAYAPAAILPLTGTKPTLVIDRGTSRAAYQYTGDDLTPPNVYAPRDILHFKGSVLRTPFEGASLIDLASEAIGISIGSEQFFARLLGNGSHFPGYLETENTLQPDDIKAVAEQLRGYAGLMAAGEVRIFDRGLKYKQNDMSLKDAQLIEQMRWQLQQICSVFRVPMAAVQDLTNGTYSNTEQQDVALGKHMATPICVNTEAVILARLFADAPGFYAKWNLDGLLRGDYTTRTAGDATLVRAGILSPNEARGHYDRNTRKGLDVMRAELNLGTVSDDGAIHAPAPAAPVPGPGAPGASAVLAPLLADAAECIRERARTDEGRGRPFEKTLVYAASKLEPLAAAHEAAGLEFDRYTFTLEALATEPEPTPKGD